MCPAYPTFFYPRRGSSSVNQKPGPPLNHTSTSFSHHHRPLSDFNHPSLNTFSDTMRHPRWYLNFEDDNRRTSNCQWSALQCVLANRPHQVLSAFPSMPVLDKAISSKSLDYSSLLVEMVQVTDLYTHCWLLGLDMLPHLLELSNCAESLLRSNCPSRQGQSMRTSSTAPGCTPMRKLTCRGCPHTSSGTAVSSRRESLWSSASS